MKLVFGEDKLVADWVYGTLRLDPPATYTSIGVADGVRLVAGVVYSNFRGCDIEMVAASSTTRWLSRGRLAAFFAYPFEQLGCRRVTGIVDKGNKHSRRWMLKLGFKLEGVAREAMDNGHDACIYGLLRRECRWITGEQPDGQEVRRLGAAAA